MLKRRLIPFGGIVLCLILMTSNPLLTAERTSIQILSATVKDKVITGADVIFQKIGETSVISKTDNQGRISIPTPFDGLDNDSITLIVKKNGYSNMVVKCPCNGLTYALSTTMNELDGLRVVLSWNAKPKDLDSHMSYPDNLVNYYQKKGVKAHLDVDDRNGYGPETITVAKKFHAQKYVYAVHNYSDFKKTYSTRLSQSSGARVFVYIGKTLVRTYYAPENQTGNVWIVFMIDENGEFHDINQFTSASSWQKVGSKLAGFRDQDEIKSQIVVSETDVKNSKAINKKGEKAYHSKNHEESIRLYQQAIELDPNNGQAYSNLGLSFQRMDRVAEAIWANRKAIALSHGSKKHIIQASSYYNIARIYEKQGKWQDALDNYKWAAQRREHSAYAKGIKRMQKKLNQ